MDAVTLCPTLLCTLPSPAVKPQAASLLIPCKPVSDTNTLVPRPGDPHVQQAPTDALKEAVAPPLSWCPSNLFLSEEEKKHHCIPDKGAGSVSTYSPATTEPSMAQRSSAVTMTLTGFSPSLRVMVEVSRLTSSP